MNKNFNENKKWYIINADNIVLGRLISKVSIILQGKHKPEYYPNKDCGDYIIIINASKILLTGNKKKKKIYYKHSGYVGNLKKISFENMLKKNFKYIILKSVKGMMPKNKISKIMIKKLKIYDNCFHKHKIKKLINLNIN